MVSDGSSGPRMGDPDVDKAAAAGFGVADVIGCLCVRMSDLSCCWKKVFTT